MFSVVLALWATALSAQSHWACDIDAFKHDMTVYYQLQKNGVEVPFADLGNYELAAFVGDECRGVGEILTQTVNEQTIHYGYLRVRSNAESGETVSFKVYVKDANQEVSIDEEANIVFQSNQVVGYPSTPKALNISVFQLAVAVDPLKGSVTGAEAGSYYRGTQVTVKAIPATGYVFTKWSDNSVDNPHTITLNGNVDMSVVFTPVTYTITYGLGGGELAAGESNPENYTIESEDITLKNPVRKGYTFMGWSGPDISDGTTDVTISTGATGNRIYTAQWQEEVYKINYNLDGGSVATPNPTDYTVNTETFTLNNPTKVGSTFAGWTGTDITGANATVTIAKGTTGERSYTATWLENAYSITYDLAGGALPEGLSNPAAYNEESDNITLVNPKREGYTFDGWTGTGLGDEPTKDVTITKGSSGNLGFTAHWTVNQYQTRFVLGNGQTDIVQSQTYGSPLTVPSDPARTGYTFRGWDKLIPQKMPAEDLTFTAKWELVTYTINYNLAGGSLETPNPTEYTFESDAITLTNPTREGYDFVGWMGPNIDGTSMEVTIAKGSTDDRTYTATWKVNQYTITFKLENGDDDVVIKQNYGTDLVAPVPTRTGYNFKGWDSEVLASVPAMDKTFTAQWEVIEYKIEYSLVGGTITGAYPTTYTVETETFTLVKPTREGYDFTGWIGKGMTEPNKTVTIEQGDNTGDLMYTAMWTPISYALSYDLGGGQLADGESNPEEYTIESAAITLKNPTREGYTFSGWTGTDVEAATMEVTIAAGSIGARSYTATWTPITYNLTYELAGGSLPEGKTNPATYTIETEDFTLTNPERTGYDFAGWTGTGLTQGTVEVKIAKGSTGDRSYTATWTPISYALSYDLGGGQLADGESNPEEYTIESAAITLKNPTREGYTFSGWTGTDVEAATMEVTIAAGSIGARSYTATWTPITYNLTYELAGGSLPEGKTNPATYTIETEDFTLVNPERTGYDFAGWTGTGLTQGTVEVKIAKGSTGDRSYTATWTPISYAVSYDLAGGQLAEGESNPEEYTIESAAITLKNPTREGYTFSGWTGTDVEAATMEVTIAAGSIGARSYTATWTPITYNLTYELAGGSLPEGKTNPATYTIETEDFTLVNPERTGYDFAGWTGTGLTQATVEVKIAKGSIGDRSYVATWSPISYAISYDLGGGQLAEGESNPEEYTIESAAITLKNPTREGYTFAGWTGTGLEAATMEVTIAAGSIGARSYTATWTPITYNLTYDLANGALPEGKTNPAIYTIETDEITLTNPERTGYDFAGWTGTGLTQATVEVKIAKGSIGDRSYVATWSPISYAISYDLGGGQLAEGESNPEEYTIESAAITLKNPTREGYTFAGWTGTGLEAATMEVTIAAGSIGARSYTATWTPITYNLTYDLANGALPEGKTNPAIYTIETDEITLTNPERTGYDFAGWTGTGLTQATVEVKIAKGSIGDRSYVATWSPISYAISYDLGGGQLAEGESNPEEYTIESAAITLKNPTREGYTFAGWTGTGLEAATMEVTIAAGSIGARSYTATWTPITYNLTYDLANGALPEGKTNPAIYTIETDEITLTNPERTGYDFAGWTGTGLTQATVEVKIAKGSIGDRSYVATWSPISYAISYDLGGGQLAEGESNPEEYTIESAAITLKNPTREGYTFAGWTGTGIEGTSMEVTIVAGSIGARSYTATWTPVTYSISYNLDGGQLAQGDTNPEEYTIESNDITLKNPTKDGYEFAGWTGSDLTEATMTVTIAKGSIGDRTYTATWTPASGIKAIFSDSKTVNVYSVNGTLVGRDMTLDELIQLKHGIYVVKGKKIAIK